jgi:four helix bundle suffix protein
MQMENKTTQVLRKQADWENLYFYQKSNVLYQLTFVFTKRFLTRGDRTVDQMVQAARSGKQNIVEGSADGVTSMEMELKLLNVARSSIKELKEDYMDYLASRHLQRWEPGHKRYDGMLKFCRTHNQVEDYQDYFEKWTDEEMCNTAICLFHMVDRALTNFLEKHDREFVEEGGVRERMTAARLDMRGTQKQIIAQLEAENATLKAQVASLQREVEALRRMVKPERPGCQG